MYRTGGHGALDLWFNVKLSPPNGLTLNYLLQNGLTLNYLPEIV